ncbi:MAG: hypothetical protein BRC35_12170 [Cyanobacteria bacterium QH_10_48_56]|nr:MAG: hypothetical protein BRC35_12170 [Cyanobacteria bacterium QH_10_48_56]
MPIPTLLLLLAIAIALGLLSPKHLGALVAWLLLGTVLFGSSKLPCRVPFGASSGTTVSRKSCARGYPCSDG